MQIVEEDTPLRTPKDAFVQLASVGNFRKCSFSRAAPLGVSPAKRRACENIDNDWERMSATSIISDHSATDSSDSPHRYGADESLSGDEDFMDGWDQRRIKSHFEGFIRSGQVHKREKFNEDENLEGESVEEYASRKRSGYWERMEGNRAVHEKKWVFCAPLSFWPHWVYQMYDSYSLARRAAGNKTFFGLFVGHCFCPLAINTHFFIGSYMSMLHLDLCLILIGLFLARKLVHI